MKKRRPTASWLAAGRLVKLYLFGSGTYGVLVSTRLDGISNVRLVRQLADEWKPVPDSDWLREGLPAHEVEELLNQVEKREVP